MSLSEPPPCLPDGYRARPVTEADVPAIHGLVTACERQLYGHATTDADRIAADLARPGLDLACDSVVVHDDVGALAGWGWVDRRSHADVHPGHRGRGIGGCLLDRIDARATALGQAQVVQTVPDGDDAAVALLRSRGYEPMVTSWLLEMAWSGDPGVPEPPAGITVRPFRPGDEHATHVLVQDAFDEWQQRRKSYDEWAKHTVARAVFAPDVTALAFDGDELVGAALAIDLPDTADGLVDEVAVRHDHRQRGIANILLRTVFHGFHRRGRRGCVLWTHSDTGALGLYERVGMTVRHSSTVFRKPLGGLA